MFWTNTTCLQLSGGESLVNIFNVFPSLSAQCILGFHLRCDITSHLHHIPKRDLYKQGATKHGGEQMVGIKK